MAKKGSSESMGDQLPLALPPVPGEIVYLGETDFSDEKLEFRLNGSIEKVKGLFRMRAGLDDHRNLKIIKYAALAMMRMEWGDYGIPNRMLNQVPDQNKIAVYAGAEVAYGNSSRIRGLAGLSAGGIVSRLVGIAHGIDAGKGHAANAIRAIGKAKLDENDYEGTIRERIDRCNMADMRQFLLTFYMPHRIFKEFPPRGRYQDRIFEEFDYRTGMFMDSNEVRERYCEIVLNFFEEEKKVPSRRFKRETQAWLDPSETDPSKHYLVQRNKVWTPGSGYSDRFNCSCPSEIPKFFGTSSSSQYEDCKHITHLKKAA
ncbi:MAG TPA: hypothetical protein VJB12_05255 [Candidatus Nanoarchaeia archaeon]|nr:hypothetical protein [Candidatus Nanoarchaeia archaeon]